jgi:hypothetical protein
MTEFSRTVQLSRHTGHFHPLRVLDQHIANVCLVMFLVTLWPLTHRYMGLAGDAALYAVQAMAKIHPNLAGDLFLQNNSQDNYTVFPLFYAWCIRCLGLRDAAMTLVIALKICFFAAAWALTHELFDRRSAFLSTAMVTVIAGSYGGYSVFNFSEDWLTARTLAEPMVITAIWLYFLNFKTGAFLVAFAAFFVHPLMALAAPRCRRGRRRARCSRGAGRRVSCVASTGRPGRVVNYGRRLARNRARAIGVSVSSAMVCSRLGPEHRAVRLVGH